MDISFGAANLRAFNHALVCLSRYSDHLDWLCTQSDDTGTLRLSAINASVSGFCAFWFTHDFFDDFRLERNRAKVEFRLQLRTIQSVLRRRANKGVQSCEISAVESAHESRIAVRLHCARGVTKTHRLTYEPRSSLFPSAKPSDRNRILIPSRTVQEWLDHFLHQSRGGGGGGGGAGGAGMGGGLQAGATAGSATSGGEVTLYVAPPSAGFPGACMLSSKAEEVAEKTQLRRAISTEVRVDIEAFDAFEVTQEAALCFPLREFKAAIGVGEAFGVPLELYFAQGGEPLHVKLTLDVVAAEMVLATSEGEIPGRAGLAGAGAGAGGGNAGGPPPPPPPRPAPRRDDAVPLRAAAQGADGRGTAPAEGGVVAANGDRGGQAQPPQARTGAPLRPPPIESTPLPGAGRRDPDRAASRLGQDAPTPLPLFLGEEDETAGAGEFHHQEEDEAEWAALDAVERSYNRGEVEVRGSQVVVLGDEATSALASAPTAVARVGARGAGSGQGDGEGDGGGAAGRGGVRARTAEEGKAADVGDGRAPTDGPPPPPPRRVDSAAAARDRRSAAAPTRLADVVWNETEMEEGETYADEGEEELPSTPPREAGREGRDDARPKFKSLF